MRIINSMIFYFILGTVSSMFDALAVIELRFFSKGNAWSAIISFLFSGSWNIFSYSSWNIFRNLVT